jgi:hypothetical protein
MIRQSYIYMILGIKNVKRSRKSVAESLKSKVLSLKSLLSGESFVKILTGQPIHKMVEIFGDKVFYFLYIEAISGLLMRKPALC